MAGAGGLTLVKLGGSLITDKTEPLTPRLETIERLAGEIARAGLSGRLVLGHGSGSFGHPTAAAHGIQRGARTEQQVEGVAATQIHAHRLHRLVVEGLWKAGGLPFSLPPSAMLTATAGAPGRMGIAPLELALDLGLTPVTFGDVVLDDAWGASICSTEEAFEAIVAALMESGRTVERVLWMGITDGIYDGAGRPIPEITAATTASVLEALEGASGEDVTGGIRLRLQTAARLAERGVPSWILDGLDSGGLEAALAGEPRGGTRVLP